MTQEQLSSLFNLDCKQLKEELFYIQSPMTLAFDGSHLGAYLEDLGNNRYRISDNAETLFIAMAAGIKLTNKRSQELKQHFQNREPGLSPQGELFVVAELDELTYYLARFFDAQALIGCLVANWQTPR